MSIEKMHIVEQFCGEPVVPVKRNSSLCKNQFILFALERFTNELIPCHNIVIPVQTGIHDFKGKWIPAFAGMTMVVLTQP